MKIVKLSISIVSIFAGLTSATLLNPVHAQLFSLEQIQNGLLNNPPNMGDGNKRKELILGLDSILMGNTSRESQEIIDFYASMMEKVNTEIKADSLDGTSIWMMYNHGFIIKNSGMVIAFDLVHAYDGWAIFLPPELIVQIDVLFISHEHKDHFDPSLADAVMANGGHVVVPSEMSDAGNYPAKAGENLMILGLDIRAHDMLHIVPGRMYEVAYPDGLKFLHTGDNQTSLTLPEIDSLDVLLLNAWINESGSTSAVRGMRNSIERLKPGLVIPGHIQELGHEYIPGDPASRVPYEWAYEADNADPHTELQVMAWGERYTIPGKSEAFPEIYLDQKSLYQPGKIEVSVSKKGMIYLVPENTVKNLTRIREVCIDSLEVAANTPVSLLLNGLNNGTYWLYARDSSGNISESEAFTILGVSMEPARTGYFHIFPNPVKSLLFIESNDHGPYTIVVKTIKGQVEFMGEMEGRLNQVDISHCPKGIHFVTFRSKDFACTRKIIKL